MREPLSALVARIDELSLVNDPAQALQAGGDARTLGEALGAAMADFRVRAAGQGVELSGHVAQPLSGRALASAAPVARLTGLLLDEAARRTGRGQLRLNVQPSGDAAMQVEIIGTRVEGTAEPQPVSTLTMSAAQALVTALSGRIEHASTTGRGPWFSIHLPVA